MVLQRKQTQAFLRKFGQLHWLLVVDRIKAKDRNHQKYRNYHAVNSSQIKCHFMILSALGHGYLFDVPLPAATSLSSVDHNGRYIYNHKNMAPCDIITIMEDTYIYTHKINMGEYDIIKPRRRKSGCCKICSLGPCNFKEDFPTNHMLSKWN